MDKIKSLFSKLKENFQTLPSNIKVFVYILVGLISLAMVVGLFNKASRAVKGEPSSNVEVKDMSAKADTKKFIPKTDSAIESPVVQGQQEVYSQAPVQTVPQQVAPVQDPLYQAPPSSATYYGLQAPAGAAAPQSQMAKPNGIMPVAAYETVLEPNLLDRSLRLITDMGESEFIHDQTSRFVFSGSSAHEAGMTGHRRELIADYVAYIRIEQDGLYTFSASTASPKSRHSIAIYLNDSAISEKAIATSPSINVGYLANTISRPVNLVRGIYKIEAKTKQDYYLNSAVELTMRVKGQQDPAMRDFVPSLISANQPAPAAQPIQPAQQLPAAPAPVAAPAVNQVQAR